MNPVAPGNDTEQCSTPCQNKLLSLGSGKRPELWAVTSCMSWARLRSDPLPAPFNHLSRPLGLAPQQQLQPRKQGGVVSLQLLSCNSLLIYNLFAVSDVLEREVLSQQLWKASFSVKSGLFFPTPDFFFFWFCGWNLTSGRQAEPHGPCVTTHLLKGRIQG